MKWAECQPWGKANPKLCRGLHFFSAVTANSEKNAPSTTAYRGVCDLKQEAKLSGYRCSPSAQQQKTHMAINASLSINSSVKAAAAGSFWSQRDLATAPSQLQRAGRSCRALSRRNQVFHRGTQHSMGTAYPAWHWGLLIPKRGFRRRIDLENGNEFTGNQFPDRRQLRYSNHP